MKEPYKPQSLPIPDIDWVNLITLIGKANSEVSRFDGLLQTIPEPTILLSPLSTKEAVLSSKIEGTQASLVDVLRFQADPSYKTSKYEDIMEIINYRKAMEYAKNEMDSKPINLNMILGMHEILLNNTRGMNMLRGQLRKEQNWIGPDGTTLREASFIPPKWQDVEPSIRNWENYLHYEDKDPYVQLAIIHVQFEMIHPFLDGNGRLGRILLPLFLYQKRSLSQPMLYLSAYFEENREVYYTKLSEVSQHNNWNDWIEFFLNAVIIQTKRNTEKARAIHKLHKRTKLIIDEIRSIYGIKLVDSLFLVPIFSGSEFAKRSLIPNRTLNRLLATLLEKKIISILKEKSGSSPRIYKFNELLEIIES